MYKEISLLVITFAFYACGNPFASDNNKQIGPIIFTSNKSGQQQIYAMQEDGSNIVRLTDSNFRNYNPRWSGDGDHIVFNSKRSANIHFEAIVMADANGDNEHLLLEHGLWPVFSPTDDTIAYSFDTVLPGFGGNYDIALLDVTTKVTKLFKEDTSFSEIVTDWSPNGKSLLVNSYKGTTNRKLVINIELVNLANSSRVKLTEGPISHSGRFSPDGQSIVYVHEDSSTATFSVTNVYIMNIDGSGKRNVTNSQTISAISPAWSSDGSKIIFVNSEGRNQSGELKYNVYSINIDGTGMVQLTRDSDNVLGLSGLDSRRQ